jgi:hypothetical protein
MDIVAGLRLSKASFVTTAPVRDEEIGLGDRL